jgi:hypothetical protein
MDVEKQNATQISAQIHGRLRRLGIAIRLRLMLRGLGWVAVAGVAASAVSLAVDYGVCRLTLRHLTVLQRLFVNGLCLAAVGGVAWRRWIAPLLGSRFGEDDLALVIERANPGLQDRLISGIQFARRGVAAAYGESAELAVKVIREANDAAAALKFRSVLSSGPARRSLLWAASAIAAAAAFGVVRPDLVEPWFMRNVLLEDVQYPKRTRLYVEGRSPLRVVRGGALTVTVRADEAKVVPPEVVFHMRFPSMGDLAETVKPPPGRSALFVKVFPAVAEPFVFSVSGNDDRTARVKVELVEPPALSDMRFTIHPPAYTMADTIKVRRSQGALEIPEDGEVTFVGDATKDLAAARLYVDDAPAGRCRVERAGNGAPRSVEGEMTMKAPVPFRPRLQMRVALADTDGFQNPRAASYNVRIVRDQPPTVQLDEAGMGGLVSTHAKIPVTIAGKDDYGVVSLDVEWSPQSAPQNVQTLRVARYNPPQREPRPVPFVLDLDQIAAMAASNAAPLQVGETVRMQAVVTDSLPPSSGTNREVSNPLTFRIVTDDEVLAGLVDSQRAMREQLRQAVALQTEIRERSLAAIERSAKDTTLALAYRDVGVCADSEGQVEDQLAATLERLQVLVERIRNNRIVAEGDVRRMQMGVIDPLKRARSEWVDPLVAGFAAARNMKGGEALAGRLRELVVMQESLLKALESIVAEMIKAESAQQVERGLRTIIKLSDRVRDMVRTGTNAVPEQVVAPAAGDGQEVKPR